MQRQEHLLLSLVPGQEKGGVLHQHGEELNNYEQVRRLREAVQEDRQLRSDMVQVVQEEGGTSP